MPILYQVVKERDKEISDDEEEKKEEEKKEEKEEEKEEDKVCWHTKYSIANPSYSLQPYKWVHCVHMGRQLLYYCSVLCFYFLG